VTGPAHPAWCSLERCTVADGTGQHQSATVVVTTGRRRVPRIVILIVSTPNGPAKLRLVVESDVVVNAIEVDIDTADLLGSHIRHLVASTRPPE
jgi:hypothetical protein